MSARSIYRADICFFSTY